MGQNPPASSAEISPAFGRSNYPNSTLQAILSPSNVNWKEGISDFGPIVGNRMQDCLFSVPCSLFPNP
jgi:hypothetical protein